jgi:hypothetical protein
VTYFLVRKVTWDGEDVQHFQPPSHPLVTGAPMLCGARFPECLGSPEEVEMIDKPGCRRCWRAYWKIWRRKRGDFEADALREIEAITDA